MGCAHLTQKAKMPAPQKYLIIVQLVKRLMWVGVPHLLLHHITFWVADLSIDSVS